PVRRLRLRVHHERRHADQRVEQDQAAARRRHGHPGLAHPRLKADGSDRDGRNRRTSSHRRGLPQPRQRPQGFGRRRLQQGRLRRREASGAGAVGSPPRRHRVRRAREGRPHPRWQPMTPRKRQRRQLAAKVAVGLKEPAAQFVSFVRSEPREPTADELALAKRIDERWNQIARIAPRLSKGSVRSHAWLLAAWEPLVMKRNPSLLWRGKRDQLDKLMAAMHRTSAAIRELERKEPFAIVWLGLDNLRETLELYRDAVERALSYVPKGKSG